MIDDYDSILQMENDKHRLLFAQRKMEFLEDFGDSIAALSAAQESHAKIAAQVSEYPSLIEVCGILNFN